MLTVLPKVTSADNPFKDTDKQRRQKTGQAAKENLHATPNNKAMNIVSLTGINPLINATAQFECATIILLFVSQKEERKDLRCVVCHTCDNLCLSCPETART